LLKTGFTTIPEDTISLVKTDTYDYEREEISNIQYNKLLQSYGGDTENCSYPDYYGGAYINKDGDLVLLVTDDSKIARDEVTEITGNDKLVIKKAVYSYKYLLSVYEALNNSLLKDVQQITEQLDIRAWGISDNNNYVEVVISKGCAKSANSQIKELLSDTGAIKLIEEDRQHEEIATATPGNSIIIQYQGVRASGSTGYRARRLNQGVYQYGFVVSGHVARGTGGIALIGSTSVGTVRAQQNWNTVDAAFVERSRSYRPCYKKVIMEFKGTCFARRCLLLILGSFC
jgi:hypothetical protein